MISLMTACAVKRDDGSSSHQTITRVVLDARQNKKDHGEYFSDFCNLLETFDHLV